MHPTIAAILVLVGIASQYAPGVMQSVISVRQSGRTAYTLPYVLPEVDGYLAMRDPDYIGQVVYVYHDNTLESFLVVDCAETNNRDGTISWMDRNNIIAEVDYNTSVRWDTIGRGTTITLIVPQIHISDIDRFKHTVIMSPL